MAIQHRFQPIVTMTRRDDGRFDVEVDWSGSQIDDFDSTRNTEASHDEASAKASFALDDWIERQGAVAGVQRFIIPACEG